MMETTEKSMKVVVTRAGRFKTQKWKDLAYGTYFLCGDGQIMVRSMGETNTNIDSSKRSNKEWWYDGSMVYSFGSDFDEVAKWVSNGRKREDLMGSVLPEFVTIHNLPEGVPAVVMEYHAENLIGCVVMKATTNVKALISIQDGARFEGTFYASVMVSNMMVWPLGPDDTITITCKGQ